MYYSCHCIKRNGLQHDCRRTGCGGEPSCLVLPDPVCAPAQLARARGLADPAPFAAHMQAQGGGSGGSAGGADFGTGGGKRFIVCELKGISPEVSTEKQGKCCKCPISAIVPQSTPNKELSFIWISESNDPVKPQIQNALTSGCTCAYGSPGSQPSAFTFDEETLKKIISSFESKVVNPPSKPYKGSSRTTGKKPESHQEEQCSRPGCMHWKPPPPCVWDLPCKADCFETHAGIQPGRNPLTQGGGGSSRVPLREKRPNMILLNPK